MKKHQNQNQNFSQRFMNSWTSGRGRDTWRLQACWAVSPDVLDVFPLFVFRSFHFLVCPPPSLSLSSTLTVAVSDYCNLVHLMNLNAARTHEMFHFKSFWSYLNDFTGQWVHTSHCMQTMHWSFYIIFIYTHIFEICFYRWTSVLYILSYIFSTFI